MTYEQSLRGLAPYLAYDKLLRFCAYYPHHSLFGELKDPQGAIWKERTYLETGGHLKERGETDPRYYSQWISQKLLPWGYLTINDTVTSHWVRSVSVRDEITVIRRSGGSHFLKVWAVASRGLESLEFEESFGKFDSSSGDIKRPKFKRKTLISPKEFIYVSSTGPNEAIAWSRDRNLHHFDYRGNPKESIIRRDVYYLRKIPKKIGTYYVINFEGRSFPIETNPTGSHIFDPFQYSSRVLGNFWRSEYILYPFSKSPQVYEIFPHLDTAQEIYSLSKFYPRDAVYGFYGGTHGGTYLLGTDGKIYQDVSNYLHKDGSKYPEYKIKKREEHQGRYSFYEVSGAYSLGIRWE